MDSILLSDLKGLNGMVFGHLNINRLANKIDQLSMLLQETGIDVMCVTETFLDDTFDDAEVSIPGYLLYRLDRQDHTQRSCGGGVCIYIQDHYNTEFIPDMTLSDSDIESLGIKVKLKNCRPILTMCVYRPPHGRLRAFCSKISDLLDHSSSYVSSETAVLGDFNIDLMKPNTTESRAIRYLTQSYLLDQLIYVPTRVTADTATLIDHIYQGSPLGKIFISQVATGNLFLVASGIFWSPVGYWNFCLGCQCHYWSPETFYSLVLLYLSFSLILL